MAAFVGISNINESLKMRSMDPEGARTEEIMVLDAVDKNTKHAAFAEPDRRSYDHGSDRSDEQEPL